MSEFVKVLALEALPPGEVSSADVNGQEVAVYNVDGKIYATSNICPHQGGPMAEGMLDGDQIICPWHAWVFDIKDGSSPVNPRMKIPCYEVKVEGSDIFVKI